MKSRSEALRSRSEVKKSKSSAAERTPDMFEKKDEKKSEEPEKKEAAEGEVTCEACETTTAIEKLEEDDGKLRCPECAAVIKLDKKSTAKSKDDKSKKEEKVEEKDDDEDEEDEEDEESESAEDAPLDPKKARPKDGEVSGYCGECGSPWPYMKGEPWVNCGHGKAIRVDDPRKAKRMEKVTPGGITVPPTTPLETHERPKFAPSPEVSFSGNRMSISWGKMIFPAGESRGFKFSNMETAQQIITVELPPGADRVKAAREIVAELQQIADIAFEAQFTWYLEKLKRTTK